MSLLVVAATAKEIDPITRSLGFKLAHPLRPDIAALNKEISFLVTGVGQMQTAFWLSKILASEKYNAVLNVGIAGSFTDRYPPCSIVRVKEEILADLGAEDNERYNDLFEMRLLDPDQLPFHDGKLVNDTITIFEKHLSSTPSVRSITVNKALSREQSISPLIKRYSPDIVNMEGAAVFYSCILNGIPFQEIRAISDIVGPREAARWDVKGAIESLAKFILPCIQSYLK